MTGGRAAHNAPWHPTIPREAGSIIVWVRVSVLVAPAGVALYSGPSPSSAVRRLGEVAGKSFHEQFQRDPLTTTLWAASAVAAYGVLGVLRPRWLTTQARHPVRHGVLDFLIRGLLVTWYETSGRSWLERNQRALDELQAELGRRPTPVEQRVRMETLKAEES